MSADNAIYIRQLPDGRYAVKDCSYSSLSCESLTEEEIDSCFIGSNNRGASSDVRYPWRRPDRGAAKSFNTYDEALDAAGKLEDESYIVEYGIIDLPRKEPVEGIRGKYTVTVARVESTEYTFDDVTPEEAQERAKKAALAMYDRDLQLSNVRLSVGSVTTAE